MAILQADKFSFLTQLFYGQGGNTSISLTMHVKTPQLDPLSGREPINISIESRMHTELFTFIDTAC